MSRKPRRARTIAERALKESAADDSESDEDHDISRADGKSKPSVDASASSEETREVQAAKKRTVVDQESRAKEASARADVSNATKLLEKSTRRSFSLLLNRLRRPRILDRWK